MKENDSSQTIRRTYVCHSSSTHGNNRRRTKGMDYPQKHQTAKVLGQSRQKNIGQDEDGQRDDVEWPSASMISKAGPE